MQVIFKIISTHIATMAIIDRKIAAFWPLFVILLFVLGFCHVKNYAYSIFIIISLNSLMSICCVAGY
jgi:hypothetical protein